jgi:phosphoenolpyruvate carboxylase
MPAPLRRDVRLLGGTLGRVLEEDGGPGLLADVERLRRATIALRGGGGDRRAAVQAVVDLVAGFGLDRAEAVARQRSAAQAGAWRTADYAEARMCMTSPSWTT